MGDIRFRREDEGQVVPFGRGKGKEEKWEDTEQAVHAHVDDHVVMPQPPIKVPIRRNSEVQIQDASHEYF